MNTALMCQNLQGRLALNTGGVTSAGLAGPGSDRRGQPADGAPGRFAPGPRSTGLVCWGCGERGHVMARCTRTSGGARPRRLEGLTGHPGDGRLYIDIEIDGQRIQLPVDSGATVSCLPVMLTPQEKAEEQCITAANGTELQVYGIYRGTVHMEDQVQQHAFFVTDVCQGVMGMDLLQKFGAYIDVKKREDAPLPVVLRCCHLPVAQGTSDLVIRRPWRGRTGPLPATMRTGSSTADPPQWDRTRVEPLRTRPDSCRWILQTG